MEIGHLTMNTFPLHTQLLKISSVINHPLLSRMNSRSNLITAADYVSYFQEDDVKETTQEDYLIDGLLEQTQEPIDHDNFFIAHHLDILSNSDIQNSPRNPHSLENSDEITLLRLHRGKIFDEFLEAMSQKVVSISKIKIEMYLPNGKKEHAEDGGGVLRDALSEFWHSFYDKCPVGTDLKVPHIRHDFSEEHWTAVASVLVLGFKLEKYFPIKLAPVFLKCCCDLDLDQCEIKDIFFNYVAQSGADVLKRAYDNFNDTEFDDVLDILSAYNSKCLPNEHNIKKLIEEIAHQELIQKPSFIIKCFSNILKKEAIQNINLKEIYEELQPTAKNCLNTLVFNAVSPADNLVMSYLKKFVKESDEETRCCFLRFCTGSNLPIQKIYIEFNSKDGVSRAPVAHTCTGMFEMPNTYENYMNFRSELGSILISNIWVMDLIWYCYLVKLIGQCYIPSFACIFL